ncbi:MAG: phosphoesterase [Myxococcales bacterium FL481]|nr:MAG: phosphoesterase [Myxococcales bacterium FL481]
MLADSPATRAAESQQLRYAAADANFASFPRTEQPVNDDEDRFDDYRGNFSKTLKHNADAEVTRKSYRSLLDALDARTPAAFEAILIGREDDAKRVRLANPQGAFAYELSGLDSNASRIPVPPSLDSAVTEAEMAELYWYSVTRDIPFSTYGDRGIIQKAADDLNAFSRCDIFARDETGIVTPATLFRGSIPDVGTAAGVLDGPFVSQFLLLPYQMGQLTVEQRYARVDSGEVNQFLTNFDDLLAVQRGRDPNARHPNGNATTFRDGHRYLARMRDLAEWVHRDHPQQAPTQALTIILGLGEAALDPDLPYLRRSSPVQSGFVTFGLAEITHLMTMAVRQALAGAWFQKWACHRRLRPEQYGARLNVQLRGAKDYGLGSELLHSKAFDRACDENRLVNQTPTSEANDGLLPIAFPEGSPAHPAYPAGHSTAIAAGVTVLKAFVNESYQLPDPVVPNRGGTELEAWTGATLTLGGELNKLVANITHARDAAGMHWRSDGVGNIIGEEAAIALLADYSRAHLEEFAGLTLVRFNGTRIRIVNGAVLPEA